MDIRNIQAFIRTAELSSFTKAASEMNYAQSTVTMQIQQLEKELGFPLFDRIGKKVSLTAPGQEFLNYANEIVHIMQKAEALGKDPGSMKGLLRIGVLESLMFGTMLEVLPRFKEEYPKVNIEIKIGQSADLLVQLKQNQLDMVYLSAEAEGDNELQCLYKRKEKLLFLASPDHVLAGQKKIPLSDLLEYSFLVTEHSGSYYGRLQELAARCNRTVTHSLAVDSTVVVSKLAQKGMGLAFLSEYSVSDPLRRGQLVRLDADIEEQIFYSRVFCHKNRWISPFMHRMIQLIGEVRKTDITEENDIIPASFG